MEPQGKTVCEFSIFTFRKKESAKGSAGGDTTSAWIGGPAKYGDTEIIFISLN